MHLILISVEFDLNNFFPLYQKECFLKYNLLIINKLKNTKNNSQIQCFKERLFQQALLNDQRKRKHSLRTIINAIFFINNTGVQWRNLDSKYPPWETIFYYRGESSSINSFRQAIILKRHIVAKVQRQPSLDTKH